MGAWLLSLLKPFASLVIGIIVDKFISAFRKERKEQQDEAEAKARDEEAKRLALEELKKPAQLPQENKTVEQKEKEQEDAANHFLNKLRGPK